MADEKSLANFAFYFNVIAVFDKQINIHCSTGIISRPISSRDHNVTDKAIAMDRYLYSGNLIFSSLESLINKFILFLSTTFGWW